MLYYNIHDEEHDLGTYRPNIGLLVEYEDPLGETVDIIGSSFKYCKLVRLFFFH